MEESRRSAEERALGWLVLKGMIPADAALSCRKSAASSGGDEGPLSVAIRRGLVDADRARLAFESVGGSGPAPAAALTRAGGGPSTRRGGGTGADTNASRGGSTSRVREP